MSDVWAPPTDTPTAPVVPADHLEYKLPPHVLKAELRAWVRRIWPWTRTPVAVGVALVGGALGGWLGSTFPVVVGVALGALGLWVPFQVAAAQAGRAASEPVVRLDLEPGALVIQGRGVGRFARAELTRVERRPETTWLWFGNRHAVFLPRRALVGDVDAFLARFEALAPSDPLVPEPVEGVAVEFGVPTLFDHLVRYHAQLALRWQTWAFGLAYSVVVAFAALLVWFQPEDAWLLGGALLGGVVIVALPGVTVALAWRRVTRLGVATWIAAADGLHVRARIAASRVGWEHIGPPRGLGRRSIALRVGHTRVFVGPEEVRSGDYDALVRVIRERARGPR
jgi:hypothetical protein